MRISINWLEEILGERLNIAPKDLSQKLLDAGFEVSSTAIFPNCSGIVAARILEISKHPNADRLQIARVSDGRETESVVCGAPNIAVGHVVFWARVGAVLSRGEKVRESVIRGVKSPGMLCSLLELGIGDNHAGIWILDEKVPLGSRLEEVAVIEDTVLDVEVTPNRPDCLSVTGIAREVSAILGLKKGGPEEKRAEDNALPLYPVEIEDRTGCSRYIARRVDNVTVGQSNPKIQTRLIRSGIRPINNVVDITNYAMLETGQPLHAFDADKLEGGKIVVRRAKGKERMRALDGRDYELDPSILVIADAVKPVAIAGVMGGEKTAVTDRTRNILIESAVFDRKMVRHTRKKLNLASESSTRFERGVSRWSCSTGSKKAERMILQIAGGTMSAYSDTMTEAAKQRVPSLTVRASRIEKILGEKIAPSEVVSVFQKLSIPVLSSDDRGFVVQSPDWRLDLTMEIDFIEEIARLRGYEKTLSQGTRVQISRSGDQGRTYFSEKKVRSLMSAMGFNESLNYGLVSKKNLEGLYPENAVIELENPLSDDQSVLRPSLAPELLKNLEHNLSYQKKDVRLFEIGKVYQKEGGSFSERERLGGAACGKVASQTWQKKTPAPVDFFWIEGVVEKLLQDFRYARNAYAISASGNVKSQQRSGDAFLLPSLELLLHPGNSHVIRLSDAGEKGTVVGYLGLIHPKVAREYGIDLGTVLFEMELDVLKKRTVDLRYGKVSLFPTIKRDCSIWVEESVSWKDILSETERSAGKLLKKCALFDVYHDKDRPGQKSLSFTLTFQHSEKTLEDEYANQIRDKVVDNLHKKFHAELRKK